MGCVKSREIVARDEEPAGERSRQESGAGRRNARAVLGEIPHASQAVLVDGAQADDPRDRASAYGSRSKGEVIGPLSRTALAVSNPRTLLASRPGRNLAPADTQ